MTARVAALAERAVPFVHVTVVRVEPPASTRPGDDAVVLADGSIEGFVGGHCTEGSVRAAALDALERAEPVLLQVLPADREGVPAPGTRVERNPCLSGGSLELFLEPHLPAPRIQLAGAGPIADAVRDLGERLGFRVAGGDEAGFAGALAAVVATLGHDEDLLVRAALDAGVGLVALVASRRRAEALLSAMDLAPEERERVHAPAGLDLGARTPEEIALSILAALVRARRREGLVAAPAAPASQAAPPERAVDPVCGMAVVVDPDTPRVEEDGRVVYFCGNGCRDRYLQAGASG